MSAEAADQTVMRGIVNSIVWRIEDEYGKPPAHSIGVKRLANTVAKDQAGDRWRELADRAVRQWELG